MPMRSMQVRTTQLQDATAAQIEVLRAHSRELRLRSSDLQAREQQLRELRFQTPAGPEREKVDRQWLNVRHEATAATLELEGVNDRIGDLVQKQREQARVAVAQTPPPAPERPPVEVPAFANAGIAMVVLFMSPFLIVLVYRLFVRRPARDPIDVESSPRLQRMEQTIELMAMDVERLVEGQRFTTRILAERHPDSVPGVQAASPKDSDTITPH
jgi:hypothetical protein